MPAENDLQELIAKRQAEARASAVAERQTADEKRAHALAHQTNVQNFQLRAGTWAPQLVTMYQPQVREFADLSVQGATEMYQIIYLPRPAGRRGWFALALEGENLITKSSLWAAPSSSTPLLSATFDQVLPVFKRFLAEMLK